MMSSEEPVLAGVRARLRLPGPGSRLGLLRALIPHMRTKNEYKTYPLFWC